MIILKENRIVSTTVFELTQIIWAKTFFKKKKYEANDAVKDCNIFLVI